MSARQYVDDGTLPTWHGALVDPQYVPARERAEYAEALAQWCRVHPEWPEWVRLAVARGDIRP